MIHVTNYNIFIVVKTLDNFKKVKKLKSFNPFENSDSSDFNSDDNSDLEVFDDK